MSVGPYKAEVFGGTVGTAVKQCRTMTAAMSFVTAEMKQAWTTGWRISTPSGFEITSEDEH